MSASRKVLLCAITIVVVLVPSWPSFEKEGIAMDEGSLLVYPELISKGRLPYRDFETFYAPANLYVLRAIYRVASPNIFVERGVGLVYRILILLALFAMGQRWNTFLAAGCTLLAAAVLLPCLLQAYAWMGGMVCALWSILFLGSPKNRWNITAAGICGGLALLFRQDLGPAIIVSGVPLLLACSRASRFRYLVGFAAALLPLGWLTFTVGAQEALNNLLLFPVFHSNSGRHLPIFTVQKPVLFLLFVHLVATVTNVSVGARAVYRNRTDLQSRLLLALGLFGLALSHQALQRLDLLHISSTAFISVSILPLSLFTLLGPRTDEAPLGVRETGLALATAMVLVGMFTPEVAGHFRDEVVAALSSSESKSVLLTVHGRSFLFSTQHEAVEVKEMLKYLDSAASPGQRLFVGPTDLRRTNLNDTFVYHLTPDLVPSSYFLEMNPGSANRSDSRLAADIARADWLVLDRLLDRIGENNDSVKLGSNLPARVVNEQFLLCGRFGPWEIYRKKMAAPMSVNPAAVTSGS